MKVLVAKLSGATHDWRSLLPTIHLEYMQSLHTFTGFTPNELVFATQVRLPPRSENLQYWSLCNGPQLPTETSAAPKHEMPDTNMYLSSCYCVVGAWARRWPPAALILSAQEGSSGAQPTHTKSALKLNPRCRRSTTSTQNPTTSTISAHIAH